MKGDVSIAYDAKTGKIKRICRDEGGFVACGTLAQWRKTDKALVAKCEKHVKKERKK
jgi:hypothetical protein